MSIRAYKHDGKTYYRVYVCVQSKILPRVRKQAERNFDRNGERFSSYSAALSEERRLLRELNEEVSRLEGRGYLWLEIIDFWESHHLKFPGRRYVKSTVLDHAQLLRNWTPDWQSRSALEIERGDVRRVLRHANDQGKSVRFQKNLKNTINVVFVWAMEEQYIRGLQQSPTRGVEVEGRAEEQRPDILTQEQVRVLLREGRHRDHPWYPVWVMAAHTGCRNGELYGLRHEDCSLIPKEAALLQDKKPAHERNYGSITVERSWNPRERQYRCTKGKTWRTIPVSGELFWFLQSLKAQDFGADEFGQFLLPRLTGWPGSQAGILRQFCKEIGIPSICFHALRACFATHLLQLGVPSIKVMKIGGWKDLKTMERYTRLAGVDVLGATEGLAIIPTDSGVMENVVNLYSFRGTSRGLEP